MERLTNNMMGTTPLQTISIILILVAVACSIASIFVDYVPGKKIENCTLSSQPILDDVNYCDLNLALPILSGLFGLIALCVLMSGSLKFNDYILTRFIKPLIDVFKLNLSGSVVLVLAFIFSLSSLGVQLGKNGIDVENNKIYGTKNVGFSLSVTTVVLYFISCFLVLFKLGGDFSNKI